MKIFVIGGAGYIGHHVARELLDNGHEVTVYDNISSGRRENIFPESTLIEGDILDIEQLEKAMSSGFDAIIHLAALKAAGESMDEPEKYSVNNITGTINILNAAVKYNIKNFIFSSTAAVYGSPKYLPIDEDHPTEPENYYGFTKLEIERILKWYDELKGLRFAALRYFNAAGYDEQGRCRGLEKAPANLLPVVMEAASGMRESVHLFGTDYETRDGTGLRDYIHVSDLATGHLKALEYITKENKSITVNLGSESGITVKEMIDKATEIAKVEIKVIEQGRRAGDPATVLATSKKANEVLNWKAEKSDVDTLIRSTWNIYKENI